MGLAPFSSSIMCSNPLLGGRPGGISLNTFLCSLRIGYISTCMDLPWGEYFSRIKHWVTHSPCPCLNILSIFLDETILKDPSNSPCKRISCPLFLKKSSNFGKSK